MTLSDLRLYTIPADQQAIDAMRPACYKGTQQARWHAVGIQFAGSRLHSEPMSAYADPSQPPTAEQVAERFADRRWSACRCRRCAAIVVLVWCYDGGQAVMLRDRAGKSYTHAA